MQTEIDYSQSIPNYQITAMARQSLQNRWLISAGLFFILGLISAILQIGQTDIYLMTAGTAFKVIFSQFTGVLIVEWILRMVKYDICDTTLNLNLSRAGSFAGASLLSGLYIFLWTLLLIIPGIIAAFNYALVPFIILDEPKLTVKEAVAVSKKMMYGNRWKFFCLGLRFMPWAFLSLFTCGIGFLFLLPYINISYGHFYRNVRCMYETRNGMICSCYPDYNGMSNTNAILIFVLLILTQIWPFILLALI